MATVEAGARIPMAWDDYAARPRHPRGEYIDGEFVVSPSPTLRHQDVAQSVFDAIRAVLPAGVRTAQAWAWNPGRDEFIPDVMVFDHTDQQVRYTGTPHLVVEVLSSDPGRDLLRKSHKYANAGASHYWVVDPEGPEVIEYHLVPDVAAYTEVATHSGDTEASLDIGVATVTLVPSALGS